jgi:predicted CoA-substrate-specific enzyme activase
MREASGEVGLWRTREELEEFKRRFSKKPWMAATFSPGREVEAFIGIDGGSTSTKAVLMDSDRNVLAKAYQLSKGNPLTDTQELLKELREYVEDQGAVLKVKGVATTGYAKDMLNRVLNADVAIVETVAHTNSALHYHKDVDVIVDVGGQDIKVIVLKNGKVKDFKLNTQCSAGNGYFLQSTAARFGYLVEEYAEVAFEAEGVPVFGYGCAVFMETDIVNFQQLGWEEKEIMAGLAKVLPKNIWLYVVSEPNLGKLGTNFVLQGGTQHNLAAVKAQYDFIKSKVPDSTIRIHEFPGESGAIGAALEAVQVMAGRDSGFIGLAAAETLDFTATRDESTRCDRCKNKCLRTFVDTKMPDGESNRFIIATCERGEVEDLADVQAAHARMEKVRKANPNFVEKASVAAFRSSGPPKVSTLRQEAAENSATRDRGPGALPHSPKVTPGAGNSSGISEFRKNLKIGIPRVLNMYSLSPLFAAYFQALGVDFRNIIYSDYTDPQMWYRGSRRGSIDQCFPSKAAIAHVHNLIFDQRRKPDIIFFPIIQKLRPEIVNGVDSTACPVVSITPDVTRAAFTKEGDVFAENDIRFLAPSLDMANWPLFELQMYDCFNDVLRLTSEESREAMSIAVETWRKAELSLQAEARIVLDRLEAEGKVGVVVLGRPYHNDPGLNHEITVEIQRKGYPIFSVDSLPRDDDVLERLFGDEVRAGIIGHPMDIGDVWKNSYSENSSKKVWAAKYVARHPNLVAIDLSSFKCGQDSPMYSSVERIIEASDTPSFTFHDIDENKPVGSIKIRVETIAYFLKRYQAELQRKNQSEDELRHMLEAYAAKVTAGHVHSGVNGFGPPAGHEKRPAGVPDGTAQHGGEHQAPFTIDASRHKADTNGTGPLAPTTGGRSDQRPGRAAASEPGQKSEVDSKVREYEGRLRAAIGLTRDAVRHFARPFERPWTKDQKDTTTVLFGGLSLAHEELVADAMHRLGYKTRPLPCPDNDALAVGKEYCNRGQCNPTYYTVGNLVKYLKKLKEQGETDIENRYVFVTAGSCGPCRFGMYEAEYRQVLRDSGFDGFRVLLFQQNEIASQSGTDNALEFNTDFTLAFIRALVLGDMVNELGYKIRPYEVNQGETDLAMVEAKRILGDALREGRSVVRALRRVRKLVESIEADFTRVKPKVKIVGEIWDQTTEGDGNYRMFRWLESEGAEVLVEPISTWIDYKIWIAKHHAEEAMKVDPTKRKTIRKLKLAQVAFRLYHNLYRWGLGFKIDPLPSQQKLADYAADYYNTYIGGGEGHLEIGKNVMVNKEKHAHMVLSLKPFGCMPSTMSDGVQSRVVADYKDAIYIPIETSGDGEISAKSRVQMKLYEAKMRARQEFAEALKAHDVTLDQVSDYVAKHPRYTNPMRKLPQHHGIGTAANLVAALARDVAVGSRR